MSSSNHSIPLINPQVSRTTSVRNSSSLSNGTKNGGEQHSVKSSDETVVRRGDGKQPSDTTRIKESSIRNRIGNRSMLFKSENMNDTSGGINGENCKVIKEQEDKRGMIQCRCNWWLWCRRRWKRKNMMWV